MAKKDVITLGGKVNDLLPSTMFRMGLPAGHRHLAHNSGKVRQHFIRTSPGDQVTFESSPDDLS